MKKSIKCFISFVLCFFISACNTNFVKQDNNDVYIINSSYKYFKNGAVNIKLIKNNDEFETIYSSFYFDNYFSGKESGNIEMKKQFYDVDTYKNLVFFCSVNDPSGNTPLNYEGYSIKENSLKISLNYVTNCSDGTDQLGCHYFFFVFEFNNITNIEVNVKNVNKKYKSGNLSF